MPRRYPHAHQPSITIQDSPHFALVSIAGVFHHISPRHAGLYFTEIGFRWSQRTVAKQAMRRTRKGRSVLQTVWSRIPPALQLPAVFQHAVGRQMRRTRAGGLDIISTVAVFR